MDIPLDWAIPQILTFMLVVARMSGLFMIAPVFSSPMVPQRVKLMLLLTLSLMLTPIVEGTATKPVPTGMIELILAMVAEIFMGLALGFSVAIVFAAVQVGASFIDTSIGFSMANIIDPLNNTQATVLGSFYSIVATLIFLGVGGLQWLLTAFKRSYDVVGLGQTPDFQKILDHLFVIFGQLFSMGFQIAAPVLVTLLLCDVVLGIVSRVVPQMNVFFVGVPLKIGVGLLAIVIALPAFSSFFENRVSDILDGAGVITNSARHHNESTSKTEAAAAPAADETKADAATNVPPTSDEAATSQTAGEVSSTDGR